MNKTIHIIYISSMVIATIALTIYLSFTGYLYYKLPIEERFYHPQYDWFQPAGIMGHGLGIVGTLIILFGVVIYILRKRYNFLHRWIRLKYLLEFHIFLCTIGPIMILFHTSFKFGGIVSIAFWSMVAVVLSGVIGRFIYIQIPRTIEGKELSLDQINIRRKEIQANINKIHSFDPLIIKRLEPIKKTKLLSLTSMIKRAQLFRFVKNDLRKSQLSNREIRSILKQFKEEVHLSRRIGRLKSMQKLFKYWHVAHLPFALIMLIIVLIHVGVTLAFGSKWIF